MTKYSLSRKIRDALYFLSKLPEFSRLQSVELRGASDQGCEETEIREFENKSLDSLFRLYGSDKSTHHDYHVEYEFLMGHLRNNIRVILEIGIGSNDTSIPQNMGAAGIPGASLRALRDWAPNAEVIGADIDPKTIFAEHRIRTFVVDQLDRKSIASLASILSSGVDLCIIDGLHTPRADVNSVLEIAPLLRENGVLVVEDIAPKAATLLWPLARRFLSTDFSSRLKRMKNGYLFIVEKR